MRIAVRNCSTVEEQISNSHDIAFDYDEIDDAIEFAHEYIPALKRWLADPNDAVAANFYEKFVGHNAVQQPDENADEEALEIASKNSPLMRLDVPIVMGCNFACAHCAAGAPCVDEPVCCDVDQLFGTLTRIKELCDGECSEPDSICLFGGEPTLHPRLPEIIVKTRQLFPYAAIAVTTNGHAVMDMSRALKFAMERSKCSLLISVYGPGIYFLDAPYTMQKHSPTDCRLCYSNTNTVTITKTPNGGIVFNSCALLWPNGDLLYCSMMHAAYTLAKCGKINMLVDGADYINVHKVMNYNEIKRFIEKATCPFSQHCRAAENVQWHVSTKQLNEWFA